MAVKVKSDSDIYRAVLRIIKSKLDAELKGVEIALGHQDVSRYQALFT
jgi:hypothetical protein